MAEYEFHEAANIFPMMEGSQFQDLVADIRKQKRLIEPIKLLDGKHEGFNPGVYIDSLVESARFECADRVQPISIDEINLCLAAAANTESESELR